MAASANGRINMLFRRIPNQQDAPEGARWQSVRAAIFGNGKSAGTLLLAIFALFSPTARSAGYSAWAVPTYVEIVSGGMLISGAFGDPNSCGQSGYIFVSATSNSRFKEITAMAFSALVAGRELRFYSNNCTAVTFHWSGNVISENTEGKAAMIR